MDPLPSDSHHPFVDLDVHHDPHTDAEEALEAIRVAIGQSTDFDADPLPDVSAPTDAQPEAGGSTIVDHHAATLDSESQDKHDATHDVPVPTLISASQIQSAALSVIVDRGLRTIVDLAFSNEVMLDGIKDSSQHGDTIKQVIGDMRKTNDLAESLIAQIQDRTTDVLTGNIDPSLFASYVPKADYDSLKAKFDAAVNTSTPGQSSQPKSRKRARQSATLDLRDETRDQSDPPTDEKGRKKRSMKLEHLVHQKANQRLGIEYHVTNFESKGNKILPAPDSAPLPAEESANGVQEFRPDFRAEVTDARVKPFLDQVVQDVLDVWRSGIGADMWDDESTQLKIRESVEVYWLRLGKRWDEQTTRALGGIHKDELVRRKQNQYRRQQSLVARRQASFDQSPLNVCKLRSLYRTLLTIDFAAKTDERPNPQRSYTEEEWYAYRKLQYGDKSNEAHEVVDIFWLSPIVRAALYVLDVFSTDQNARIKRKGKPKTPAPGFHLPNDLWDRSALPPLRPKDDDGLPVSGGQGIVLFRFHVDPQVIEANPEWARGLYDNPPIPEADNLLPHLTQVMNATVYQHLVPLVKLTRDSVHVPRFPPDQIHDMLQTTQTASHADPSASEADAGTIGPMIEAFHSAQPSSDSSNINLDLSLETLVYMTQNSYMATNPLANQLALASVNPDELKPPPPKIWPGSSQQARKMGKRTASEAPGGAVEPVPKRVKGEPYVWNPGQEAPERYLNEDAGFVLGL